MGSHAAVLMYTLHGGGTAAAAAECCGAHGLDDRVAWRLGARDSHFESERCDETDAAETVEAVESADDATLQLSHACAHLPATARVRRSRLATFSSDTARTSIAYCGMPPLEAIAARRDDALMLFNHFSTSSSHPSTISYSMVS